MRRDAGRTSINIGVLALLNGYSRSSLLEYPLWVEADEALGRLLAASSNQHLPFSYGNEHLSSTSGREGASLSARHLFEQDMFYEKYENHCRI